MRERALQLEALEESRALPVVSQLAREARGHLPIWFVYFEAIGLLHATLANFPEAGFASLAVSRATVALTVAFPIAWFVLYFCLRARAAGRVEPLRYAAIAAGAVALPVLIFVGYRPHPLRHDQLSDLFEASQLLWVGLFAVQIVASRGAGALLEVFGVTLVYGLVLENTGIVMGFFHEPSFRLYLGPLPAPVCTVVGWSVVFYVATSVIERLSTWLPWLGRAAWRQAVATTLFALSLDAQLDPMASMSGVFWRWNDRLPAGFLGVPLLNYAAWTGAFLPYSYFLFRLRRRRELGPVQQAGRLLLGVPAAALVGGATCFAIMIVLEGGLHGPSLAVLGDFVRRLLGI